MNESTGGDRSLRDEKLFQLCRDFAEHKERFENHEMREEGKFDRILAVQHQNTLAISDLTGQVSELVKDTRDIIQLHKDFQGVARVGDGVQRFALWCMKWGGILGGLAVGITWLIDHFSKNPHP